MGLDCGLDCGLDWDSTGTRLGLDCGVDEAWRLACMFVLQFVNSLPPFLFTGVGTASLCVQLSVQDVSGYLTVPITPHGHDKSDYSRHQTPVSGYS